MRGVIGVYFGIVLTPWKLVGFIGALMFAFRWIVQAWATRRAGRPASAYPSPPTALTG